ncbi:preprotein translocase subunit SecG [Neogemmobacter tilapiae]|uniref:Protein-export membrane protein SecG n=1 Tax=Neogemmobacter tilapiae TaxID=875041 RepID=A0A918TTE2_9RHOB|nr:preprotein translocase subunit SecG [Gemmobacter tilapiae]GHC62166.1 hypothetical protein GCM10007315_27750 [Gemmobacter tilapiae]
MQNVVLTIHLILSLLLVGIVLLQRSEGRGGLMGGDAAMTGGRQAANALTKLTWILAAGFITTSITLTILAAADSGSRSVVDQFGGNLPAPEAPATTLPGLTGDLTPPTATDAPATPPRADAPAEPATEGGN